MFDALLQFVLELPLYVLGRVADLALWFVGLLFDFLDGAGLVPVAQMEYIRGAITNQASIYLGQAISVLDLFLNYSFLFTFAQVLVATLFWLTVWRGSWWVYHKFWGSNG